MSLTAVEYEEIHIKECVKYDKCKPECRFWGLCEDKAIPICNINSAIYVAEKIKEGVFENGAKRSNRNIKRKQRCSEAKSRQFREKQLN